MALRMPSACRPTLPWRSIGFVTGRIDGNGLDLQARRIVDEASEVDAAVPLRPGSHHQDGEEVARCCCQHIFLTPTASPLEPPGTFNPNGFERGCRLDTNRRMSEPASNCMFAPAMPSPRPGDTRPIGLS